METPKASFHGLNIAPKLLEILTRLHFVTPTPIQQKAIPIAIEGKDLIGIAQTGTGKTLAFGIPLVQRLAQIGARSLILVPTRELALQVHEVLEKIASPFSLRTAVLIGGAPMYRQIQDLRARPRIVIGTPGRLMDHVKQRNLQLSDARILVIDEADRMFDMGFAPQVEAILQSLPRERQTLLFSATMPGGIIKLAARHMKMPTHVEIAPAGTTAERVVQELFIVKHDAKTRLLSKLLEQYHGSILLFSRTKIGAKKINRAIRQMGHTAAEIHSDRSMGQRRQALEGFKSGRYRVLVATDIAARGIDVSDIELVINYDLPEDAENYVHRIGRTARAGQGGRAISFATPDQGSDVQSIERLIRTALPLVKHPEIPEERFHHSSKSSSGPRHGGYVKHQGRRSSNYRGDKKEVQITPYQFGKNRHHKKQRFGRH